MPDYYNYDQNSGQQPMYNPPQYQPQAGMEPPPGYVQKSRVAAGILAILMGTYGIHSFSLGALWTGCAFWTAASTPTPTASS